MIFYLTEIDIYNPTTLVASTLTASDLGYRKSAADSGGIVVYPPRVNQAFVISRQINLDPTANAVGAAAGEVRLSNHGGAYNSIAASSNSAGRDVRVLRGAKTFDATRGYYVDPSYTQTTTFFKGLAEPWFLSETELQIPIRDATYWLQRPLQSALYLGTGGYNGSAELLGKPKPKMRGFCRNVSPTLLDATNLIYQYNDAAGVVQILREGGATNITFQANTTNLYAGVTNSGQYRTDNSRGLFQLGSTPVNTITVDAYGNFPVAGLVGDAPSIARYLLSEDCQVPAAFIDTSTFNGGTATYPYTAGVYYGSDNVVDGVTAVSAALTAYGAKLFPKRDGRLSAFILRAIPASTPSVASFGVHNIVSLVPVPLPSTIDPPPHRVRARYANNFTVQTTGHAVAAPASQRVLMSQSSRTIAQTTAAVSAAYRRPNDTIDLGSVLYGPNEAQEFANALGALWGVRRRLYNMTVPIEIGIPREIGNVILLTWPADNLASGLQGQIVGESFRSQDATIAFTVLV